MYFLRKIIFHFLPKNKIISSGKTNIIFRDDTRKIIFQCDFQNIWGEKHGFSCSVNILFGGEKISMMKAIISLSLDVCYVMASVWER